MKSLPHFFSVLILCIIFTNCSSSDEEIPQEIPIVGLTIDIEGTNLLFGEVVHTQNVTKNITLTNTGNSTLVITSISVPEGFSVDWPSGSIPSGSSQEVTVTFSPGGVADFIGNLEIISNAEEGVFTSICSGQGISEVYEGNISFQTDAQIETFANKGYTTINGELCIGLCSDGKSFDTREVTSLAPLSSIESVGALRVSHCNELQNLDGIQQIDIAGQLQINNCASLTAIDELTTLRSISSISIYSNNSLQNIDGLQNLESVLSLGIINNAQLNNIDGLLKLTETSFLRIYDNPLLENIAGLENINRVEQEIYIGGSGRLTNLDPLANILHIGERITITNLPLITNLNGLRNVVDFGGVMSITRNRLLHDYCDIQSILQSARAKSIGLNRYNPSSSEIFSGLCEREVPLNVYDIDIVLAGKMELDYFLSLGYDTIEGDFILLPGVNLSPSEAINSLAGLGLKNVLGNLELTGLDISNLEGLNDLESISGNLIIQDNTNLSDFCAITAIIENSQITDNYMVSGNLTNPSAQDILEGNCN